MTTIFQGKLFLDVYQPQLLSTHLLYLEKVHHHGKKSGDKRLLRTQRALTLLLPVTSFFSCGELTLRMINRQCVNGAMIGCTVLSGIKKVGWVVAALFLVTPALWCKPIWGERILRRMELIDPKDPQGVNLSPLHSKVLKDHIRRCSSVFETLLFPFALVTAAGELTAKSIYYLVLHLTKTIHALSLDLVLITRCALSILSLPSLAWENPQKAIDHAGSGHLNLIF